MQRRAGFTIVELLIVIVVIGILATITIVAYTGIQNQAYDASVQSDLDSIAKNIANYELEHGSFPQGSQLDSLKLRLNKQAYDPIGYTASGKHYNVVYCWAYSGNGNTFALVAKSKSGNVFQSNNNAGVVKVAYSFTVGGSDTICSNAGAPLATGSSRDWFLYDGTWQSFAG